MLVLGLGVFWFKYQDYFGRGATSATARLDYWQAAAKTLWARPLFGSGPGTFQVSYKQLKSPEAEMTRLAHNDYLQQGSDSGWIGILVYAVWIWGGLAWSYKRGRADWQAFAVWLGLMGLALQSCVEFGLYIPAVAWIFFLLLGWFLGLAESRNRIDKPMAGAHSGRAV
jgi:O-antigen ligase